MQTLQVYVNDERIDLFSDESINVTQSIQNVRDISKIFTDFSRSFTIPASKTNNKIFKHYNNKNIVGGFDARKKVDARLEINNKPFRDGKIKLDGANLKNGTVDSYKITFFGNTVNLKDLLAEDKLETLDWLDNFSVNYSATDIREALQIGKTISFNETVYPNAIVAPLITNTTRLFYDSVDTYDAYPNANGGNTYYVDTYDASTHSGVYFEEIEYAIRVHLIVKAIEQEYGIVFSNDFFNESNLEYYNLYMWLHREKGRTFEGSNITTLAQGFPLNTSNRSRMESDKLLVFLGSIPGGVNTPINYSLNITANTSSTFKVTIKKDGATYKSTTVENGTQVTLTGTLQSSSTGYKVYIDSEDIFNFTATWDLLDVYTGEQDILSTPSISVNTTRRFIITEQTPNMRIIDFLNGLFKTFNLTAYQRDGVIVIDTLDDYYKDSTKVWEIDKHIDSEQEIVDNALPFNEINFKYKGNNTFLAKKHANQFGQDWGKLEYTSEDGFNDASPNVYNVELPFEHMKYERLLDVSDKSTTTIMYGWFADDKGSSYVGDPLIFYPVLNSGTSLQFLNTETYQDANSRSEVTSYFVPSNSLSLDSSVNTSNLNFYLQANEYTFTPAFTNTLFANYYREYIRNVFDIRNRLTKLNAVLPLNFLLKFELNDKIRFRGNYYRINSVTSDLITGKASFELINEYDFIETIELDGGEGQGGYDPPLPTGDICPYADSTLYTIDSTEITADRNCDNTKPADCPNADSTIYTTDTFDITADLDCAAPFPEPEPEPEPEPCNTIMFSASDDTTSSGLACGLSFTRSLWHNGSTTYPQIGNRIYSDANCSSFPDDGFIKVTDENTTIEVVRQGSNLFGTVISKSSCQSNFLPSVSTLSASAGQTTATLNGVVTNVGMPPYTTRGFYWMEGVGTPNASNNVVFVSGTDINTFSTLLSNLQPSRTYSYVAFATNSEGTATGTVVQFYTSSNTYEPTVVTNPATNILQTSATLNGRVSDVGNPNYTQKGFYWKLGSGTPTASDNVKIVSGTAPDNYSGNISGLLSSNLYSFRAFATNSVGTALGQVLTFSSASPVCDGGTLHFDAGTLSGVNMSLSTGQLPYTICDGSYDIDLNLFNNVSGEWSSTSEVTSITVFEGSTNVTSDFTITKTLDSNGVIIINLASDTPAAFEDGDKFYTVNVTANPSTTYQTDITVTQNVSNTSLVVTDINGNTVAPNNHTVVAGEGKAFSFTYTYTADSGYQFTGIGNIQNAVGNGVNVVIDSYTSSTITVIISGVIGSSNQTATASWNGDAISTPATSATLLYRYGTSGTFVSIPSGGIEVNSQQVVQIQVTPNGAYYVGLSNNNAIQSVTPTTVNSGAQTVHTLTANTFTGGEGLLKTSFRVYPRDSVSSIASAVLFYQGSQ